MCQVQRDLSIESALKTVQLESIELTPRHRGDTVETPWTMAEVWPDIPRVDSDHAVIIRLCGLNSSILRRQVTIKSEGPNVRKGTVDSVDHQCTINGYIQRLVVYYRFTALH